MNKIIVFANELKKMKELCSGAKSLADKVILISSLSENGMADELWQYDASLSAALIINSAAELILKEAPDMVWCEKSNDGRLFAGCVAAKMGVSPLADVSSLEVKEGRLITQRLVYGGSAVMTESSVLPAVAMLSGGIFEAAEENLPCQLKKLSVSADSKLELLSLKELEAKSLNLSLAKRVVAVGRGIGEAANIPAAEQLAKALNAELGCTRPVAEEEHWLKKERYIGVSGCMMKPSFYMALGVSGQIQHMVGVNSANVIFAVNKDENAPIIAQADYSLIADVTKILPELCRLLEN